MKMPMRCVSKDESEMRVVLYESACQLGITARLDDRDTTPRYAASVTKDRVAARRRDSAWSAITPEMFTRC